MDIKTIILIYIAYVLTEIYVHIRFGDHIFNDKENEEENNKLKFLKTT